MSHPRSRRRQKRVQSVATPEILERRLFLSAVASAAALDTFIPGARREAGIYGQGHSTPLQPQAGGATAPFSVAQIREFYGIGSISFSGVTGNGSGQTIAVIDAYRDTGFVSTGSSGFSASDLHVFDQEYLSGIDPPSFTVIPEQGHSLPTQTNAGWAGETALDVEWAHAIAPAANIVLVECRSANSSDLITAGVAAARAAGATVISMSFIGSEGSDSSYDTSFTTSASNNNVTYLASTGDNGVASTGYPALSPYVVAVGGTAITTSDSAADYGSEVVWNESSLPNGATGGGISSQESKPGYQSGETLSGSARGVPDVAFDADPQTGVEVYDSSNGGYYGLGGTSLSSPCWAGLIAIADQGRVLIGEAAMNGFSTTLPRLYELPSSAFHDITSGNNTYTPYSSQQGYSAGTGYDLVTGLGTPVANALVPDLAGVNTITGRAFVDNNGDGIYDGSDTPVSGKAVYLDLNNSGIQTANDPTATTNAQGMYSFSNQSAGGTVRLNSPAVSGYAVVPASASVAYGTSDTINFTYFPLSFSNTTGSAHYTIQTDASSTNDQILVNGTLTYSVPKSALTGDALTFSLTGAGDSFTVNAANGNPLPAGGITLSGPTVGLPLTVIGTASANDTFNVSSASVTFDSDVITASKISLLTLNPGTGTDSLVVNSGSATIAPQTPGGGMLTRNFSNVSIAAGSSLLFATAASHGDHMLTETSTLSVLGQLDLGGNDLIVHNGNLANINTLLATGYANGYWNGQGIASAAAAADTSHLTALGGIQNSLYGGTSQPLFDSAAPVPTDVLIKYTYYGDATLDGKIDGTDYSRIDSSFNTAATGWYNGDFNYDKHINGSDYTLIDNDFNTQGATLAAQIATPAAMVGSVATPDKASATATSAPIASQIFLTTPDEPGVEKRLLTKDLLDGLGQSAI